MSSNYPGAVDTFETNTDWTGDPNAAPATARISASDVNNLQDGLHNTQATLGTNPQGSYADVKTRLDALAAGGGAGALTERGNWTTITGYSVSDVVTQTGIRYVCRVGHTSGTFATDLTANKWVALDASGTTAGGDLSGTLPNPTVAKVNGVAVTGTPTSGQVITATSGTAATWQTPSGGGGGAVSSVVGQTGAVTGTQILADTTVAAALTAKADASATTTALAGKLATTAGAVGTTNLADGSVTAVKVAADVATQAELDAAIAGLTATYAPISEPIGAAAQTTANAAGALAATKADDTAVVHKTGAETVAGVKTFSSAPVVPTGATGAGGTSAASQAYADTSAAAAAAGSSLLLNYGQSSGQPKRLWEPARAATTGLWSVSKFYSGGTTGSFITSLNSASASPSLTGNGSIQRQATRVTLPSGDNVIHKYRLTYTLNVTGLTSGTATVSVAPRNATFAILTSGAALTTVLQAGQNYTNFRSTVQLDYDKGINQSTYLDVVLEVQTSGAVISLSNVTLVQIEDVVPALRVGWTSGPASGATLKVWQPLGYNGQGVQMFTERTFGTDGVTECIYNGAAVYPENALSVPWNITSPNLGNFGPQRGVHQANNNQVFTVYKADGVTTELLGNAHGGEVGTSGTFTTDYQAFADYYDGNGWTLINDNTLAHRCWRVKLVANTKITRTDQASPFCNVVNTYYLYADGTMRLDRTVTFNQDQKLAHWFYHMTTLNAFDPQRLRGRIGAGQKVIGTTNFFDELPPTTSTTAPTTATTGGTIPAGTYSVLVTQLSPYGETAPRMVNTSITTTGSTSTITANWAATNSPAGAAPTGFNVYVGLPGLERLAGTAAAGATSLTVTALPAGSAASPPKYGNAATGLGSAGGMGLYTSNGGYDSPVADWTAIYDPICNTAYGLALDRDQILTMTGVNGIRGTLLAITGLYKNYWHLNLNGANGNLPYTVPSGSVYSSTLWFFSWIPADPVNFEREQTIRAANVKSLTGYLYPSA